MKKMMLLAIAFLLVVSCNSKVEKKDIVEKWKFENGQWKELKLIDDIWK